MPNFDRLAQLDGLISREVGEYLYHLAQLVSPDDAIVEIGSYHGQSTCYLAAGRQLGTTVYAVDPWSERESEWRKSVKDRLASPSYLKFKKQVASCGFRLGTDIIPLQTTSVKAAQKYRAKPVGLLYIDGNHLKHAVINDIRSWTKHLTSDAIIVLDDYGETKNPGVKEAVHELIDNNEISLAEVVQNRLAIVYPRTTNRK